MPRAKNDGRGRLGGRAKGTPNKTSAATREKITEFIVDHWDDFILSYDAIDDPLKKCLVMVDLLPFCAPKMSSVEYKDKTPGKSFKDELDEDSGLKTRE